MAERNGALPASGWLNLLLDRIHHGVDKFEGVPARCGGSCHAPRRAFDARRERRFEFPGGAKEGGGPVVHLINPSDSAAVTICPETAAALAPPYPALSRITAKAIRRVAEPAGAHPTHHARDLSSPTSAVP